MANIPFLHHGRVRPCGTKLPWRWKPSPRLRNLGFVNVELGDGPVPKRGKPVPTAAIVAAAERINQQIAEYERRGAGESAAPPHARAYRFTDLRDAYEASADFRDLRATTRSEYRLRLRQLESWADGGNLPVRLLDKAMVRDLRDGMVEGGTSPHKSAAILRVLRLLCNWAVAHDLLDTNPVSAVKIRTAPSRTVVLLERDVESAAAYARAQGWPSLALHFQLGLWTMQRQGDLLALNRMAWRELDNCDPADRAVIAGENGAVMGFRLRQSKTGAFLDIPVLPEFHAAIADAFARGQYLFPDDGQAEGEAARNYPPHLLRRRGRAVLKAVGLGHAQLRDLRGSGMCMFRDFGVEDSLTTAMSGHAILGHKSILDTYMPKSTRAACAALARAQRARLARIERENAK